MNVAIILAGGVGMRMNTNGLPKQFLSVMGKPIIIYTLEKFELCHDIDFSVVVCHNDWIEHLKNTISKFALKKEIRIVAGGKDRQESITNGINALDGRVSKDDIIVIHDSVRPFINNDIIHKNIDAANKYGCAMTVRPVIETVVVSPDEVVRFDDFQRRDITFSLTAPQSFKYGILKDLYTSSYVSDDKTPILDAAMQYAQMGNYVPMVKEETGYNIKITTPTDFFYFKAVLELEENKNIFGL